MTDPPAPDQSPDSESTELTASERHSLVRDTRNLYRHLVGGGFADLSRTPSTLVLDEPQCMVRRYESASPLPGADPVLLVPPLAAAATSMDLRRDHSLAGYLAGTGRPTYLVDYGDIRAVRDASLGLEHWIDVVLPKAVRAVCADAGGVVHTVGWSIGGILELFMAAAHPDLPLGAAVAVASPFDFTKTPITEPIRWAGKITGGRVVTNLVKVTGGLPGHLNTLVFTWSSPIRQVRKPEFLARKINEPEILAHMESVDALMGEMEAYPGRSFAQIYHTFIHTNHLRTGQITFERGSRRVSLSDVRIPVMAIAGKSDPLFAPVASAHHVVELLPNSPEVRLRTAPGGHLGVLTGPGARRTTWPMISEFLAEKDRSASGADER